MGLFSRRPSGPPPDLVSTEQIARFGRYEILGQDLVPLAAGGPFELIRPLFDGVHGAAPDRERVHAELRRHATQGLWPAVGAWRFSLEFAEEGTYEDLVEAGIRALQSMRITNLAIHLAPRDMGPWERITGGPPPDDGFFGPPVFDSEHGPTLQYYVDQAVTAAAARTPDRCAHDPSVDPGDLPQLRNAMWDLGLLVLRGPLLVNADVRFEPHVVREAVRAATGVDHHRFARALADEVLAPSDYTKVWSQLGAARFVEDYLAPELTGSPVHLEVLDAGLRQLSVPQLAAARRTAVEVMTPTERSRWHQLSTPVG